MIYILILFVTPVSTNDKKHVIPVDAVIPESQNKITVLANIFTGNLVITI